MKDESHERAQKLLVAARVESLRAAEQAWLDSHLAACGDCRTYAESLERTLAALHSFHAPVNPALVDATRRRVQLRALELRRQEAGLRTLWVSCALSWLLGVASAPLLWWAFQWAGQRLDIPRVVWITAFGFWWLTPAVAVGAALAWQGTSTWQENAEAGSIFRLRRGVPPCERNAGKD
jgi:anti-sigma factor RsiW